MLICSAAKYLDICAQTKNTLMVINTEWTWKMQGTLTERDGIVHFTPPPPLYGSPFNKTMFTIQSSYNGLLVWGGQQ